MVLPVSLPERDASGRDPEMCIRDSVYSAAEKASAADGLKRLVEQAYDEKIREIDRLDQAVEDVYKRQRISGLMDC